MYARRTGFAVVLTGVMLAGCTGEATAPPTTSAPSSTTPDSTMSTSTSQPTDSTQAIDRCDFPYGAQLALYDTNRRTVSWTTDVPWWNQTVTWIDRSVVVSGAYTGLTALHLADGTTAWERPMAADGFHGITHQPGTVAAVDGNSLVAIDSATGEERWSVDVDGQRVTLGSSAPSFEPPTDTPIFSNEGGTITARDVADGTVLWTYRTTGDWGGQPVLGDEELLEHAFEGAVNSLDPTTGRPNWVWTSRQGVAVGAAEVVSDDTVLVATTAWLENPQHVTAPADAAQLVALDRATGEVRWTAPAPNDLWYEPFRVVDGVLVHASADENAQPVWTGVDVATGATRWSVPGQPAAELRIEGGMLFASPYESGADRLVRLDPATGAASLPTGVEHSIRGLVPDGDHWLTGLSTANDAAAAIDSEGIGALAAMDPVNGAVSIVATFRDAVQHLLPDDRSVVVVTADDMLFCD